MHFDREGDDGLEKSEDAVREIKTQIEINAAPERVWAVLTDFQQTPSWNPFDSVDDLARSPKEGASKCLFSRPANRP